jgi:xanthine dehydrogenase accessory factor
MEMHSTDQQILNAAREWLREGHRFVLVTVARTWGSAPRAPGSWMVLRDDGRVQGSVSGGCIEDDLIDRLLNGKLQSKLPFLLKYGVTKDEAFRYGLPCGGTMELVIEPEPDLTALEELARRINEGQLVRRSISVGRAGVSVAAGSAADSMCWDGCNLTTLHGPSWRLLIVGAGQISSYLAQMARALDYQVLICDPRTEYATAWDIPGTTVLNSMPDDAVIELNLDPHSAVVALTHDPKLDDMALLEALKSPAFYVGALGSAINSMRRRERLLQYFDLSQAEVDRLHAPIGLPIGSHTPPEIAIAILAEMTAVRNGASAADGLLTKPTLTQAGCSIA